MVSRASRAPPHLLCESGRPGIKRPPPLLFDGHCFSVNDVTYARRRDSRGAHGPRRDPAGSLHLGAALCCVALTFVVIALEVLGPFHGPERGFLTTVRTAALPREASIAASAHHAFAFDGEPVVWDGARPPRPTPRLIESAVVLGEHLYATTPMGLEVWSGTGSWSVLRAGTGGLLAAHRDRLLWARGSVVVEFDPHLNLTVRRRIFGLRSPVALTGLEDGSIVVIDRRPGTRALFSAPAAGPAVHAGWPAIPDAPLLEPLKPYPRIRPALKGKELSVVCSFRGRALVLAGDRAYLQARSKTGWVVLAAFILQPIGVFDDLVVTPHAIFRLEAHGVL